MIIFLLCLFATAAELAVLPLLGAVLIASETRTSADPDAGGAA